MGEDAQMFFFNKGKKGKPANPAAERPQESKCAPGTRIHFDPNLVGELKEDHQALLALYDDIKSTFESKQYGELPNKLDEFRSTLQQHLLTENVRLYIYLAHTFQCDDMNFELIRDFRKEMDGIAKTVMNFLQKYDAIGIDNNLAPSFSEDFATIGEVLNARLEKEEKTLYPLYMEEY